METLARNGFNLNSLRKPANNNVVTVGINSRGKIPNGKTMVLDDNVFWEKGKTQFVMYHKIEKTRKGMNKRECKLITVDDQEYDLCLDILSENYFLTGSVQVSKPYTCRQSMPCTIKPEWQLERSWKIDGDSKFIAHAVYKILKSSVKDYANYGGFVLSDMRVSIPIYPNKTGHIVINPIAWRVIGNTTATAKNKNNTDGIPSTRPITVYIPLRTPGGYLDGIYGISPHSILD